MKYLVIALLLIGAPAHAKFDLQQFRIDNPHHILEAGKRVSWYDIDADQDANWAGRIGYKGLYAWGALEDQLDNRMVGQGISQMDITSFGVGAQVKYKRVGFFIEAGYADIKNTYYDKTIREAVYTTLVGTHNVAGLPWDIPVDFATYEAEYELDDNGMVGRVGVFMVPVPHIKIEASYRWLEVDEYYAILDPGAREEGRGYWEEHTTRDLGAFELTIYLTY